MRRERAHDGCNVRYPRAKKLTKVMRGVVAASVAAENAIVVRRVVMVGTIRRLMNVAATIDRSEQPP